MAATASNIPGGFNIWANANRKPLGWNGTDINQAWNQYGTRYQGIGADRQAGYDATWNAQNPAPAATPAPVADPVKAAPVAIPKTTSPTMSAQNAKTLMPYQQGATQAAPAINANTQYQGINNYMTPISESPTYKFQVEQGTKDLQKQLLAAGLTGSGYQGEQIGNLISKATADEATRQQAIATADAGNRANLIGSDVSNRLNLYGTQTGMQQSEADRYAQLQQNEALRQERNQNSQWDKYKYALDTMIAQSPLQMAYGAAGNLSSQYQNYGQTLANYLKQMGVSSGGSSSGGSSSNAAMNPAVTGQGTSAFDLMGTQQNAANNFDWSNLLGSILLGNYN